MRSAEQLQFAPDTLEGLYGEIKVAALVHGHDAGPDARHARWDRWRTDGDGEDTIILQARRHLEGQPGIADEHRHDMGAGGQGVIAEVLQSPAQVGQW